MELDWQQTQRVRAAPSSEVTAVGAEYRSARHRLAFCTISFEREAIPAQLECRYLSAKLEPAQDPKHAAGREPGLHGQQPPSFLAQSEGYPEEIRDQEGNKSPT